MAEHDLSRELAEAKAESIARRQRIAALKKEVEAIKAERDELAKARAAIEAERDQWKAKAEATPEEIKTKFDEYESSLSKLKGEITTRDHRDAFKRVAATESIRPEAIEDIWTLSGYKAEGDINESAIKQVIGETVKARPYLKADTAASVANGSIPANPPRGLGAGADRGGTPPRATTDQAVPKAFGADRGNNPFRIA